MVIINGEWGQIEEITLTYVVVLLWDERRLVVPNEFFTSNTIQNWTRNTKNLLPTVYFFVDYTIPVQKVREKFFELLNEQSTWDKRFSSLIVSNLRENMVELRMMMSAVDSNAAWQLKCIMR